MKLNLKNLIISALVISLVGGLVGGLLHHLLNSKMLRNRIEGVCQVVGQKEEDECKKIVDEVLDMTDEEFQGYVANGGGE